MGWLIWYFYPINNGWGLLESRVDKLKRILGVYE